MQCCILNVVLYFKCSVGFEVKSWKFRWYRDGLTFYFLMALPLIHVDTKYWNHLVK
jgi:hypothetical protein